MIMGALIIASALCLDIVNNLVRHTWVQATADASADAGANRRYLNLGTYTDEFLIDPVPAETVARSTFDKNLLNLEDMGITTDTVENPVISFPDNYSISVDVDLTHDLGFSESTMDAIFAEENSFGSINDSIHSTSNINHRN